MSPSAAFDGVEGVIAQVELQAQVPDGREERFSGYGTWSLRFASGHRLALRRFPASSLGLAHTSVWLRDPSGRCTVFADVPRAYAFAPGTSASFVTAPIRLAWSAPGVLKIEIPGHLSWEVSLAETRRARWASAALGLLPEWTWRVRRSARCVERFLAQAFGARRIAMRGWLATWFRFRVAARAVLAITESRATVDGADLGALRSTGALLAIGDVWVERSAVAAGRDAPLVARRIAIRPLRTA